MDLGNNIIMSLRDITLCYKSRSGFFKRFEHNALSGVTFDLFKGETLGVLGRNGCGKSSLLKIMAGLINPSGGDVICRRDTTRSLLSLGVGFLPDLSGRDNAVLSSMLQGKNKREAVNTLEGILDYSELGKFFDQPVKSYSAGMKARLGFAIALLTNVDILMIDEVLGVGDVHFRKKAEKSLKEKIHSQQTVVLVSHGADQVKKFCDRAIWLKDGVVNCEGDKNIVVNKYHKHMGSLR